MSKQRATINMRAAVREYIRERTVTARREIRRETDQEIREAMARSGWLAAESAS